MFRLITGEHAPDIGSVRFSRGTEVGYLPQIPQIDESRALEDEVATGFEDLYHLQARLEQVAEEMSKAASKDELENLMQQYDLIHDKIEHAGGFSVEYRIHEILVGLGFRESDFKLPMGVLSGGQKCRAALAKLLLRDPDFLLLDEPSNHLDIDAVRWLENYLLERKGGAIVISHDRYLLDRLAQSIVELHDGKTKRYVGNYTAYQRTRENELLTQERQFEQDAAYIEKEREYVARYGAGQRARQAKGRLTRLERQLDQGDFVTDRPRERARISMAFKPMDSSTRDVLEVNNLTKRYDARTLFANVRLRVVHGQRLGITGPNGSGKSTLLKCLLGKIHADEGTARFDPKAIVGYYAQEEEPIEPERSIVAEIMEARPDLSEEMARAMLGRFLFSGDDAFKRLGALSGGERSRVRLLKLMLLSPTIMILDEPTNHLDIDACEALEEALREYEGTIITVSHDRYFLDRLVTRLLVVRPEGVSLHEGNYSAYVRELEARAAAAGQSRDRKGVSVSSVSQNRDRKGALPHSAPARHATTPKRPKGPYSKHSAEQLEAMIHEREKKIAEMTARFGDQQLARDHSALAKLHEEFESAKRELAEIEAVWFEKMDGK
jgi:ATP-binding cassette subfamily F protein 3